MALKTLEEYREWLETCVSHGHYQVGTRWVEEWNVSDYPLGGYFEDEVAHYMFEAYLAGKDSNG